MVLAVVLGMWLLWLLITGFIEADPWVWYIFLAVVGVGVQIATNWSLEDWWLGVGYAGATVLLVRITDLLTVVTDWFKLTVLRRTSR